MRTEQDLAPGVPHHRGLDPERGWATGLDHGGDPWTSDRTIVHLVLLDGRLVDSWSESAEGTRWEHLRTAQVRPVVQPPPRDPHQDLVDWLTAVCGSRPALDALVDEALGPESPGTTVETSDGSTLQDELDDLLVRLCTACFDDEALVAMRRAATVLAADRGPRVADLTVRQRAAGIAWAVAKANGLFGAGGTSAVAVQHALGLSAGITTPGRCVERVLTGPVRYEPRRPSAAPDLLVLGRTDLLLRATRRALIGWRDSARAAQAAPAALHPCTRCAPG